MKYSNRFKRKWLPALMNVNYVNSSSKSDSFKQFKNRVNFENYLTDVTKRKFENYLADVTKRKLPYRCHQEKTTLQMLPRENYLTDVTKRKLPYRCYQEKTQCRNESYDRAREEKKAKNRKIIF